MRGRAFNQRILGFGETVLYKLPGKGPLHQPDGNMGTQWLEAIFLGFHRSSNTYILGTENGKIEARTITRRPEDQRWSADGLAKLKATPWSTRERAEPHVRFREEPTERDDRPAVPPPQALRKLRINKKGLEAHGYTEGCAQ